MMDAWFSSSLMTGVVLAEQRLEQTPVRVEARRVQDGVLGPKKAGEPSLELFVYLLCAADETHARHAVAPAIERLLGGSNDTRVVGEAR